MFQCVILALLFIDVITGTGVFSSRNADNRMRELCYDKDPDCSEEVCRRLPYTAKERCPKFCGLCDNNLSFGSQRGHQSSSQQQKLSRKGDIATINKENELECVDLNNDCDEQICKNYPYTAKARCAKTCGYCRKELIDRRTNVDDRYLFHTDNKQRSGTSQRVSDIRQGNRPSGTTGRIECKDEDSRCSQQSCLDQPYSARSKCPKTCGFCSSQKTLQGSTIDLEPPPTESSDRGSMITLDNDDTRSNFIQSTATTSRYRPMSRKGDSISTQSSRYSSVSSRTDSIRKPSSSSTLIQQPTTKPPGVLRRYPGRTGPCIDENKYCELADCRKYPNFAQRYCEKTCSYC